MTSPETFRSLVQPGRVHRRLYTDPAIFEAEMERNPVVLVRPSWWRR
jgi:hypothetical protein